MRNPLRRLARSEQPKRPLRERLAAAKGRLGAAKDKAGRMLAVNRIMLGVSLPAPVAPQAPPVDRAALVNYATFLALERDRVCTELYPHMGVKGSRFVLSMNEAWMFFRDGDNSTVDRKGVPPASARALKVLDLVGIDWRKDATENDRRRFDEGGLADTGERPAVPFGWPGLDAGLTEALDDMEKLDAAQNAMYAAGCPDREGDTVPGYDTLEDERGDAIRRLSTLSARGLPGLQAKARAMLNPTLRGVQGPFEDIAESLARDLIGARPAVLDQHRPDPIFAVIDEAKRLFIDWTATGKLPLHSGSIDPRPENVAAQEAFNAHVADVLLETVPTTAAGSKALARYAVDFIRAEKFTFDETSEKGDENVRLLDLIARSPLRA